MQLIPEPALYPAAAVHVPEHLRIAGGLYTPEELTRWEAMLTFPSYHKASAIETSLQVCQAESCLGMHTLSFDPSIEEDQSLWNQVEELFDPLHWIDNHGVGILLVMLLYVILAMIGRVVALLIVVQDQGA